MDTEEEEFVALREEESDEDETGSARPRPRSVISDVCGEEQSVTDIVTDEIEAGNEISYRSVAVSDVLSPEGKNKYGKSERSGLGRTAGEGTSVSFLQGINPGQESVKYNTINTEGNLTQHSIEETAANLSHSALEAALADLSLEDPSAFGLSPHVGKTDQSYLKTVESESGYSDKQSSVREFADSSKINRPDEASHHTDKASVSQYPDEVSVSQHPDTYTYSRSSISSVASSRCSSKELTQHPSEVSVEQRQVEGDGTRSVSQYQSSPAEETFRRSLNGTTLHHFEQVPGDSVSQYIPLQSECRSSYSDSRSSTASLASDKSSQRSVSQYQIEPSALSQYSLEPNSLSQYRDTRTASRDSTESQSSSTSSLRSITQYPLDPSTLTIQGPESSQISQYPLDSTVSLILDSTRPGTGISESKSSDGQFVMFDSNDSRPGTVIERQKGEGYCKSDIRSSGGGPTANQDFSTVLKQSATDPQVVTSRLHDTELTFDQSIKFAHGTQQETLGDTLLQSDRHPISSSTPHSVSTKASYDLTSSQQAFENLAKYLKMTDENRVESDSDSNIGKLMHKVGIDDYVAADRREELLDDYRSGDLSSKDNAMASKERDSAGGEGDSGLKSGSLKSPNWRELIPDTPSFGHSMESQKSRSSGGTVDRFSLEEGAGKSQSDNADRASLSTQESVRSVEGSENAPLPAGGLLRERTSYDLYNREMANSAMTSHVVAPARTHKSSVGSTESADGPYRSSDTLLGGYEARDAVSLASGGSKDLLQSAHASDEEKMAELKRSSRAASDTGESKVVSSRGSVGSAGLPSQTSNTTYKDEKWGNKVSGMLDGISRRQNLSARVATILAGTPPKTNKTEPVSRIPVKVSQSVDQSTPSAATQTNAAARKQAHTVASVTEGAADVTETKEQAPVTKGNESETPRSEKSASEDEDVERVTEEYKAILKGVSSGLELNQGIDELRAKLQETETPPPQTEIPKLRGRVTEYILNPEDLIDSGSETEDSLDRDVKRILSKYGRNVRSFPGDKDIVPEGRGSPAGSADESDDTLSHRVHSLLTGSDKNELKVPTQPVVAYNVREDRPQSITVPGDLESTGKSEETFPADLGSLKGRLQDALEGVAPAKPVSYSSDPLNDRVRRILADTTHLESEDTTSKRLSSNGSPTSSIDYHNLERDLDEIQSHLESLKGEGSGRQSAMSEQSAELLKYVEGRADDETLRKARAVIGDSESDIPSTSSSRLEPEGQGRNTPPLQRLPLSPLLTSGMIPMDVALDMLHGSDHQGGNNFGSVYPNQSGDTDTLLKEANARYNRSFTPDVAGFAREDPLLNTAVSATDREVMEINGVDKSGDDSLTERVSKLVESGSVSRDRYDHCHGEDTRRTSHGVSSQTEAIHDRSQPPRETTPGYDTSLNMSSLSPLTKKPFTAFGNMQNLFTNQLNKVSSARFDTSLEARSPLKYHELTRTDDSSAKGIARAYEADLGQGQANNFGSLTPTSRARIEESRVLSPYGRERSPEPEMTSQVAREVLTDQRFTEDLRATSPQSRGSSPRDGANSRASMSSGRLSLSGLRPYKPPGSKMMYYVETGTEGECNNSLAGYSETTVESTHPGSDDAVGPNLPAHAYGSRRDTPKERQDGLGVKDSLGTIQEQSMDETDAAKQSLRSSKQSKASSSSQNLAELKRASSGTPTESRYRYTEERERSFSKTKDWLNGNWPSKEDVASVSPGKPRERHSKHAGGQHQAGGTARSKDSSGEERSEGSRRSTKFSSEQGHKFSSGRPGGIDQDSRTSGQYGSSDLAKPSGDPGVPPSYEPRHTQYRPARAMYDDYSEKCQQLQSKYRNLKDRAEEAISTLITSSSEPRTSDVYRTPSTAQRSDAKFGGGMAALEFGTPKRLGTSRLSLEASLNDTGRKSLNETAARRSVHDVDDTAAVTAQPLNNTVRSEGRASGGTSSRDFLKYHTPAGSERPSGHRGPDYWSSKVRSNYDDLSQAPLLGRLSHESEERLTEQLQLERETRIAAARQVARLHTDTDNFQPLHPDEEDTGTGRTKSTYERAKSPYDRLKSSTERAKSPYDELKSSTERAKSPYEGLKSSIQRAKSPYERTKSPHHEEKAVFERAKSPYEKAKSPSERTQSPLKRAPSPDERTKVVHGRARSPNERARSSFDTLKPSDAKFERVKSPHERTLSPQQREKSPHDRTKPGYERAKSPYETTRASYGVTNAGRHRTQVSDISIHSQKQQGLEGSGSHLGVEKTRGRIDSRSPGISHVSATRPSEIFLQSLGQGSRSPIPERGSQDAQEMWERFDAMQKRTPTPTGSDSQRLSIDLEQLTSLLSNPAQHIIKNMQSGTVFDHGGSKASTGSSVRSSPGLMREEGVDADEGRYSLEEVDAKLAPQTEQRRQIPEHVHKSATDMQSATKASVGERGSRNVQEDGGSSRSDGARRGGTGGRDGRRGGNRDGRDEEDEEKRKRRIAKKGEDTEEANEDTDEEEMETLENEDKEDENSQTRKMAWVIRDEELLSIPEDSTLESVSSDFTTSSEIDSDGKLVTKTTKRHLPNDPKLLKLQQKIAKQKEKYKRVQIMAQRRHNKIVHLEQLENKLEQRAAAAEKLQRHETTPQHTTVDSLGTVTSKTTSTPSVARQLHNDSTLGVSDITSTSTLTQGTIVSEDMTFERREIFGEVCYDDESDQSSVCHCCHKKRARSADSSREHRRRASGHRSPHKASRSQSPPKSPQKRMAQTYPSPTRRKKEKMQEPPGMKLREVDYNRSSISPNKTQTLTEPKSQPKKSTYMEIDLPKAVPKTKRKGASSSRRETKAEYVEAESKENTENRTGRRQRKTQETDLSNVSVQVTPKVKTREFGATCPTPMVPSPPVKRQVRHVTMVSEAIQTEGGTEKKSAQLQKDPLQGKRKTQAVNAQRDRRDRSPGMFTPESSENDDPAVQEQWHVDKPRAQQRRSNTVKAAMAGVTWFVPMKEPQPWKKPLQERQANAVSMETWPQIDPYSRRTLEDLMCMKTDSLGRVPSDYFPKHVPLDEEEEKKVTGLQRAFEKRMQIFISKSRERQRLVKMRAEERSLNAVHGRDRDALFRVDNRKVPNVDAHPLSDLHFKPKKRFISKAEMREMAALKFKKLPEVVRACEEKKRQEFYKTNRMRAQIYKQKVLNRVLKKRAPQLEM